MNFMKVKCTNFMCDFEGTHSELKRHKEQCDLESIPIPDWMKEHHKKYYGDKSKQNVGHEHEECPKKNSSPE